MKSIKIFKSNEGRDRIRCYYNNILSFFPFTQRYVDTSFGTTFLMEAGTAKDPAVILLHGSCSNSAAWLADMPALAEHFHVFAVDIVGEPGNSEENRLDVDSDGYLRWLAEVLDELGIKRSALTGNSMGGWLALGFAAAYPERADALVLLAPSGIVPPKQSFLEQTKDIACNTDSAEKTLNTVMADDAVPKEVLEFMTLVMENFNPITGALPVLTDKQLLALNMPVLFLAGTNDVTMDVRRSAQRLASLVPHAKINLTDSTHVITSAAKTLIPFLLNVYHKLAE